MLDSIKLGIQKIDNKNLKGLFINPVDIPAIEVNLVKEMIINLKDNLIIMPEYKGKRGHPVLYGKSFIKEILRLSPYQSLRELNKKYSEKIRTIKVNKPFYIFDVDTKEDYENFLRLIEEYDYKGALR